MEQATAAIYGCSSSQFHSILNPECEGEGPISASDNEQLKDLITYARITFLLRNDLQVPVLT